VKRFVQPLREVAVQTERVLTRFETPPGWQSQVDWGQGRVYFGQRAVVQHFFVLTLGYSRRGFYCAYPDEKLGCFLEAHERAFEHFGGHTREHLYDRPRTVCRPTEGRRIIWNPTFKAFAEYWGFEPRLCQPYRAQTKGKVESGVKYVKGNFLPGRRFCDQQDFDEQLVEWMVEVADVRVHGTTHERPIDRFSGEREHLMVTAGQPGFRLEALASRTVATDYLVSFETNRYSVPFRLIGETVQVQRARGAVAGISSWGAGGQPPCAQRQVPRCASFRSMGPGRLPAMPACAIPLRRGARQGAPRAPRCKCAIWPSMISSPVSVPWR
jgi:hypothetical protein